MTVGALEVQSFCGWWLFLLVVSVVPGHSVGCVVVVVIFGGAGDGAGCRLECSKVDSSVVIAVWHCVL